MRIQSVKTRLIKPGDDLISLIEERVKGIKEGSLLAVTSKVVSLWEGRWVKKGKGVTLERLVKEEADKVSRFDKSHRSDKTDKPKMWRSKHCWLALKQGFLIPNAGVDESNAFGGFILWPKDPFVSAKRIHNALVRHYKIKRLGVLITDSWPMPLRHGVVGIAVGYYGFAGQKNYVGKRDLVGRIMKISKVSVADTLASAAVFAMGEGDERTPLALIEGAPVKFTSIMERGRLRMPPDDDVFREVLKL